MAYTPFKNALDISDKAKLEIQNTTLTENKNSKKCLGRTNNCCLRNNVCSAVIGLNSFYLVTGRKEEKLYGTYCTR